MKLPVRQWVLLVETDMEDIRSPATRCDHCSASSCFDHEGGTWMNSGWWFDISDHSNDGYWLISTYMLLIVERHLRICFFSLVNIGVFYIFFFVLFVGSSFLLPVVSTIPESRMNRSDCDPADIIVSWTAVGFNAEKLHTFYRDQKKSKKILQPTRGLLPKNLETSRFFNDETFSRWVVGSGYDWHPQKRSKVPN